MDSAVFPPVGTNYTRNRYYTGNFPLSNRYGSLTNEIDETNARDELFKHFDHISEIIIEQEKSNLCFYRTVNFKIKTSDEQTLFYVKEENYNRYGYVHRLSKKFDLNIINNDGNLVMKLHRPLNAERCVPQLEDELHIEAPIGHRIGIVRKNPIDFTDISYKILNADEDELFDVDVPFWKTNCYLPCLIRDLTFPIVNASDGFTEMGSIKKLFKGYKSYFINKRIYRLNYLDPSLDSKLKVMIMAALFLIDLNNFDERESSSL